MSKFAQFIASILFSFIYIEKNLKLKAFPSSSSTTRTTSSIPLVWASPQTKTNKASRSEWGKKEEVVGSQGFPGKRVKDGDQATQELDNFYGGAFT